MNAIAVRRGVAAATLLSLAAVASACGGGDDDSAAATGAATTTSATTPTTLASTTTTVSVEAPGTYAERVSYVLPFGFEAVNPAAPPGPLYMSAGAGSLWVGHHRSHGVTRVDPETNEVVVTVAIDPAPGSTSATQLIASGPGTGTGSVLATDDAVWVLDIGGFIWSIDPHTNTITKRIEAPGLRAESGMALVDGTLWVGSETGFMRVDTETGAIESHPLDKPSDWNGPQIVASPGVTWYATLNGNARVNQQTNAVDATVYPGTHTPPLGVSKGLVWSVGEGSVSAVDPKTNTVVRTIDRPGTGSLLPDSSTLADDTLWVVEKPDGNSMDADQWYQLVRFDLDAGDVEHFDLMSAETDFVIGLAVADGAVWAADFGRGNLLRVDVDR